MPEPITVTALAGGYLHLPPDVSVPLEELNRALRWVATAGPGDTLEIIGKRVPTPPAWRHLYRRLRHPLGGA